jgi:Sulfatase
LFFLFIIVRRFIRDIQLAGLATLGGLMLLFPLASASVPAFPVILIVGFASIAVGVWRRKRHADRGPVRLPLNFTYVVNVVAICMMVAVTGNFLYQTYEESASVEAMSADVYATLGKSVDAKAPQPLPHIVHIVLDGYSRADVLRDVYGFDNTPFLNALRQRGFRVADHATTPYNQTLLVMSSIYLLKPITDTEAFQASARDKSVHLPRWNNVTMRRIFAGSVQHGSVTKILTDLGYQVGATPTVYRSLQLDNIVTEGDKTPSVGHFARPETYILGYFMLSASPILRGPSELLLGRLFSVAALNYKNLTELPSRRFRPSGNHPRFIFEHVLAPHPPFNIAADGSRASYPMLSEELADGSHVIRGDIRKRAQYHNAYLNKLRYVNGAILAHIDHLKKSFDGPLVIILHGDHGGGLHLNQDHLAKTCANERFKPLFAVYATDEAVLSQFTDDFNIINIYRALFRALLDADLPNLPNRSTYVSWEMNETAPVDRIALDRPCETPEPVWTAEDKGTPSPTSRPSISR